MNKRTSLIALVALASIFLSACSPAQPGAAAGLDQAGLIEALGAAGAEVDLGEPVEQAFFSMTGQILSVNGADVQVFEYASAEDMEADAALVAEDGGSVGTSMITWVATPHFFKSGRVLVLYVGDDAAVLELLLGVLGEQFAGR
ncbi:MAG: hypothetical protein HYZ26_02180 [Chloroflexi bacterium]|nr:hypothetical protein [Chloroflexota bacterium]